MSLCPPPGGAGSDTARTCPRPNRALARIPPAIGCDLAHRRQRAASATSLSRNAARNGGEPFIVIWRSSGSIPSFATYSRVWGSSGRARRRRSAASATTRYPACRDAVDERQQQGEFVGRGSSTLIDHAEQSLGEQVVVRGRHAAIIVDWLRSEELRHGGWGHAEADPPRERQAGLASDSPNAACTSRSKSVAPSSSSVMPRRSKP